MLASFVGYQTFKTVHADSVSVFRFVNSNTIACGASCC